jgi:catechol 2,3-dioxygenase-like lactoylglutathione lyase family enzyme
MGFTMAPAFISTDLDRTSRFWVALGFAVVKRYEGYMIVAHPTGIVIHFGLDRELVPSENMTNAYLGFTTSTEAVALYEEWVDRVSEDGFIHAPGTKPYGMIEWGMTDPDANALRVGGPAEST